MVSQLRGAMHRIIKLCARKYTLTESSTDIKSCTIVKAHIQDEPSEPLELISPAPAAPFPLYSLPPELRRMILIEILNPGDIYLDTYTAYISVYSSCLLTTVHSLFNLLQIHNRAAIFTNPFHPLIKAIRAIDSFLFTVHPHPRFRIPRPNPVTAPHPGVGILATCRELYEEGQWIFYPTNWFHLAPGPIAASAWYFHNSISPTHRNMVRSIVVSFTAEDLTPAAFLWVDHGMKLWHPRWRSYDKATQRDAWTRTTMTVLWAQWFDKMDWLMAYPSLERAALIGPGNRRGVLVRRCEEETEGAVLRKLMMVRHGLFRPPGSALGFLPDCYYQVELVVRKLFAEMEVGEVKDALDRLGPGTRLAGCKVGVVAGLRDVWDAKWGSS